MGLSWGAVLQALLITLAVKILFVIGACLWKSAMKVEIEPMVQPDVEMGTVNGSEGIDQPGSFPMHGSDADYDDAHHEGNLGDMAGLQNGTTVSRERASEQDAHFSAITDYLPNVQLETLAQVTEHETIGASVPIVVDVSHAQQVEVLTKNINQAPVMEGVDAAHDGVLLGTKCCKGNFH